VSRSGMHYNLLISAHYFRNASSFQSKCRCQSDGICDSMTGMCRCPPGWTGHDCANRCHGGYFGKDCGEICECFNGAHCHYINGSCTCKLLASFDGFLTHLTLKPDHNLTRILQIYSIYFIIFQALLDFKVTNVSIHARTINLEKIVR
jgi:hypothetical protein